MERDRSFNFKLLVPPRVNSGQVSAIRPQEVIKKDGDFMNAMQQGHGVCLDKGQNVPFSSMATLTNPTRQDIPKMKVVPPMEKEENNCNPGQLYAKLFDEFEKIRCWKVKADSDIVQKERRLQENKRTIETQRKAIQELQFANESLSMKLEEYISENEDLRNKDNATRNLCNILKDTFQRSAEKMHLFESEREETHHLFMENSERIQKIVAAFESLRIQVETDQEEMRKVKEDLLQFEEIKDKCCAEYNLKEEEVAGLQTKLERKENELQKTLLELHETQKHCKQLQHETDQQCKLLKNSESDRETLLQKLHTVEHDCQETQKKYEVTAAALEQRKAEYAQILQSNDLSLQELNTFKNQQAEKQEQFQATIKELQKSLALEIQRTRETEGGLMANMKELERTNTLLCETMQQSTKKDGHIKTIEDELDTKSKSIESLKGKIHETEATVKELTAELSKKTEEVQQLKNEAEIAFSENDVLKRDFEAVEKAQEDLKKFAVTEIKLQELEEQLLTEIKKNHEHEEHLRRDIIMHEVKYEELLSSFNQLMSEKMAIQQQLESGASAVKETEANMKASEEKAAKLTREIQRFEEENQRLREEVHSLKTKVQGKSQETELLEKKLEENYEHLQEKVTEKEKQIKTMETKVNNLRKRIESKVKVQEEYQKENKTLKKQMANKVAKTRHLENVISGLQDESQNLRSLHREEHQKLQKDLEYKMCFATELENEVQKLRLTATEAIKNKEDVELKCQHKIADMVTLMEKHKTQCDRMIEEKDAELEKNKKKEMEAVAQSKSLELDVLKYQSENDQLKKRLKTERKQTETLQKELTDLKKEVSLIKINQKSDTQSKQAPALNYKRGRWSETPKVSAAHSHVFDFSTSRDTPTFNRNDGNAALTKSVINIKDIDNDGVRPPTSLSHKTSKIRSYRIRTPPSGEKAARLGKISVELDPKSDSSDQNDLLTFASTSTVRSCKVNISQKSPVPHKSPGNLLKLAAMKRMRDAGWTAVTGYDKKKRKNNETVFA